MMTDWLDDEAPLRLPLYASTFAKKSTGSSDADDEDDDDEDDEDDDEDDEDEDPDEGKTDEELRAELKSTREKLTRASNTAGKRRKQLREERERKAAPAPKGKKTDDDDDKPDLDTIREEAKREGEKAGIDRAKKSEARAALISAGVSAHRVARVVGMLDLDDLDLDDDGLDGIEDAIDELKKDVPEFFAKTRKRRESVAPGGDRDGDGSRKKELTTSQRQAALVTGGSRR